MKEDENGRSSHEDFWAMLRLQPTDADCERCRDQLDAYTTLQLDGADYQSQLAEVAQHLDGCVQCAEAYAYLYELKWAEQNDQFVEPATIPTPDLTFLTPTPSLWDVLQQRLQMTQERIALQLNGALLSLLAPTATPSLVRSGEDGRFGQTILTLTADRTPETTLPFALNAYADKENEAFCLLEVTVEPLGLSWPELGGFAVMVQFGDELHHAQTDDWGTAVFANIPRAQLQSLQLQIEMGGK